MFKPITLNILAFFVLCAAGYVFFKNRAYYYYETARTYDFYDKGGELYLKTDENGELVEVSAKEFLKVGKEPMELAIQNQNGLTSQGRLKVSQERLQTATDLFNAAVAKDKEEQEIIEKVLADTDEQKKLIADLESKQRERQDELRFFKDNPDVVNGWNDKVRIAQNSMDEIKVLDKEIKELNTMVSNRETNLANLTDKNNGLKTNIADLKAHILSRSDGRSEDGLVTKIRAVYNTWGFVTLSDGDKTGVVLNSTLDVIREDEVIAKLLVTIVEQDTASADIVPGSMAADTFLMIGDKVVPAKVGTAGADPANPDAPAGAPGAPGAEPAADTPPAGGAGDILDLLN